MRNLFNFIARQYFFFLFLALETVAILLLINTHTYQRSYAVNSANRIAGSVYEQWWNVKEYFFLKRANRTLAEENALLANYIQNSFLKTDQQVFVMQDTTYVRQFSFMNAKVISNSIHKRNNYITLNKGRKHGVKPDMGVVTANGVIGIVKDVSENFSSVISFLHADFQLSVKLKKNNQMGTALWEGYSYREATLLYFPTHIALSVGDTLVTSGFSNIFPEAIPVGVVKSFVIKPGDNFYTITMEFFQDFNALSYVRVVNNIFREEQMELEKKSQQ